MAEPAASVLVEETPMDRLQIALAEARADLERRDAALLKLQGELMLSRLEVAGARQEALQFQGMLRRAEEAATQLGSAGSRNAEITQLHAVIGSLQAEASALRAGMDLLRTSASWRMSAPVRVAGRLMRGIRRAALGRPRPAPALPHRSAPVVQPAVALPSPGDADASAIFHAARLADHASGEAEGIVTLDALYRLSRSL